MHRFSSKIFYFLFLLFWYNRNSLNFHFSFSKTEKSFLLHCCKIAFAMQKYLSIRKTHTECEKFPSLFYGCWLHCFMDQILNFHFRGCPLLQRNEHFAAILLTTVQTMVRSFWSSRSPSHSHCRLSHDP